MEITCTCIEYFTSNLFRSYNRNTRSFLWTSINVSNWRIMFFSVSSYWLILIHNRWQVKNSGLMLYTVIVKKLLSNRVNDNVSEKNLNITSFFIKYPFLRHWFSYKLDLIHSTRLSFIIYFISRWRRIWYCWFKSSSFCFYCINISFIWLYFFNWR